jgi:hypothetical protein
MLGTLTTIDDNTVRASWTDSNGATLTKEFVTGREATLHIAKYSATAAEMMVGDTGIEPVTSSV